MGCKAEAAPVGDGVVGGTSPAVNGGGVGMGVPWCIDPQDPGL